MYLAKRKALPIQDWWCIGGRVYAGEDEKTAISRLVKREISLDLDVSRFEFLRMNRYVCNARQQVPQTLGSDTLSFTFVAELTESELGKASKNLDVQEYDTSEGLKEFDRAALMGQKVHPAVTDVFEAAFPV